MFRETKARSLLKTLSWRFWATLTTIGLVLLFVGETAIALSIGGLEVILKMIIYFVHERVWDKIKVGRHEYKPFVLWITGLSGSGKTSLAKSVVERLKKDGLKVEHLDGETVRDLFPETGFTKKDIDQHIERVGYLASKLEKHGIFVVASFLSPYKESRDFVKKICNNFIEVYINTPLEICEKRDPNGLYKKARAGVLDNFPGISAVYEKPDNPDIIIDTANTGIEENTNKIIEKVSKYL